MNLFAPTSRLDLQISGGLTVADWVTRRALLVAPTGHEWEKVFDDFLMQRLRLRYLDPIDTLQMNSSYRGEGFSIVAIQVTLIEFLAATVAGMSYRHRKKGDPALTTYEYDRSAALFIDFLSSVPPFSTEFTKTTADEFYVNIRCGLLHEARTKQGWSVWAESHAGQMVDPNRKIVFRNNLQSGLLAFLDIYRKRIVREKNLQVALVRKIDSLCME